MVDTANHNYDDEQQVDGGPNITGGDDIGVQTSSSRGSQTSSVCFCFWIGFLKLKQNLFNFNIKIEKLNLYRIFPKKHDCEMPNMKF